MTRLVSSLALFTLCVLATTSCSVLEDTQSVQSAPVASVSPGDLGQPSNSVMPTLRAASPGCVATDEVFSETLSGSETGQAYRSLAVKRSGETTADERCRAWEAFTAAFKNDYSDRLAQAVTDETSKQTLTTPAVYVERDTALDSGAVPEFTDQQGAEEALKRGKNSEVNLAYTQALAEATNAHGTLTTCMSRWPVVF